MPRPTAIPAPAGLFPTVPATGRSPRRPGRSLARILVLAVGGLLLSACGTRAVVAPASTAAEAGATAIPSGPAPAAPALPAPVPFEAAVARAGDALLDQAHARLGDEPRVWVIDPLLDAASGAQTAATAALAARLEARIPGRSGGRWTVQPLAREALGAQPLLLIGSLTPQVGDGAAAPEAHRLWLTLIDLRTRNVVAKALDLVTAGSVDAQPLPYHRDSPAWHLDRTVRGYLDTCQAATRPGDPVDPRFLAHLPAQALIAEAIQAYGRGQTALSNQLFDEASPFAGPGDLRVLNGLYLTHWRMGQVDEAREALGKLVEAGLQARQLSMNIRFLPGSAGFDPQGDLPEQHGLWMREIAAQAARGGTCLRIVGHVPRGGDPEADRRLSRQRAESVRRLMAQAEPELARRLDATGAGSGLGPGDDGDALDQRVEFKVVDCR